MNSKEKNDKVNEMMESLLMWEATKIYEMWTQLMSVTEGKIVVPRRVWISYGNGGAYTSFEKDGYSMVVYAYFNSKDINIEYRPPSSADYVHVRFSPNDKPSEERVTILNRFCEVQYTNERENEIADMARNERMVPQYISAWRSLEQMSSGNLAIPDYANDGVCKKITFWYEKAHFTFSEDEFCEIVIYKDRGSSDRLVGFFVKRDRQFGELLCSMLTEAGIYKGK